MIVLKSALPNQCARCGVTPQQLSVQLRRMLEGGDSVCAVRTTSMHDSCHGYVRTECSVYQTL